MMGAETVSETLEICRRLTLLISRHFISLIFHSDYFYFNLRFQFRVFTLPAFSNEISSEFLRVWWCPLPSPLVVSKQLTATRHADVY
jgi:hypothetical protein